MATKKVNNKNLTPPPTPPPLPTTTTTTPGGLSMQDFLNDVYGTTPSSTIPSSNVPNAPALTPVANNQTSSRLLKQAETRLRNTAVGAANLGVSIPAELMPTDYTNIPILQAKKEKPGLLAQIGGAALGVVSDVGNVIDIPKRAIISAGDEFVDIFTEGDTSDFWAQLKDPTYGFGDAVGDVTNNKWVNRAIGFVGDVVLDPTTYLTLGGSALVKVGVSAAGKTAAREVGETLVKEGTQAFIKQGVKKASVDALTNADGAFKLAQKALDDAIQTGDEALIATTRKAYEEAGQAVTAASMDISKELGTKAGQVLIAEEARQAAYQKWATSTGAAREAAAKELDRATELVVKSVGRKQARRSYRGEARESLAEQARRTRQIAENQLESLRTVPIGQAMDPGRLLKIQTLEQVIADLSDETIKNIAVRGYNAIKGDVARTLGVTSRSRFTAGTKGFYVPSAKLTTFIGSGAVASRLGAINKLPGGERILKSITPMGRKGLFTADEVLEWRTALRTGKVKADDAVRYTALLAADKNYNQLYNATRRKAGQEVSQAVRAVNDQDSAIVAKMLDTPEASWRSLGITPSPNQLSIYTNARAALDAWYDEANQIIISFGGTPLKRNANYFPHTQSEAAIKWIANNPDAAERLGKGIAPKLDRQFLADNFLDRVLVKGKKWFGKTLDDADIRGGVARLNEIARDPKYGNLNFDFFDTDLKTAIARYGDNHARFMATMQSLDGLTSRIGAGRYGDLGAKEVIKEVKQSLGIVNKKDTMDALRALQEDFNLKFVVDELNPTPGGLRFGEFLAEKTDELLAKVEGKIDYDVEGTILRLPLVDQDELIGDIEYLRELIATYGDPSNLDDPFGNVVIKLTQDQFDQVNLRLFNIQSMNDLPEGVFNKLEDTILNRLEDIQFVKQLGPIIDTGWQLLESSVGELLNLQVKEELASIFSNLKRIKDPTVARNLERTIGSFNRFFKSYATSTPGFHVRNAISNAFQLLAAGVDFNNVAPALKHYNNYWRVNRRRVAEGLEALTPGQYARSLTDVSFSERELIRSALLSVDMDATQFAEAVGSATGRVGITGKELGPTAILGGLRSIPGTPIRASRKVGQLVEGTNRFILTYDGLRKGLNPSEAFARTNKFLFDYSDLSSADRVIRQIIPFWIWTSRNLPLQLENILTNPRAYNWYLSAKENIMDEEQPGLMPNYLRKSGAFTVGGNIIEPNLGFPGAGASSPLEELLRAPLYLATGNESAVQEAARNLIGSSSPLIQAPIEYVTGTNLFGGYPLVSDYSKLSPEEQRRNYILNTILPSASWYGRIAQAGGFAPEDEGARQILGLSPISTRGKTPEEVAALESERRSSALARYFGLPIRPFTEREQISEADRRRRAIEELSALEERRRQG